MVTQPPTTAGLAEQSAWWLAAVALRIAVRRWPAALRAEMAAEWAAELYEIKHAPGAGRLSRAWRAVTFAVSLACARPPHGDEVPGTSVARAMRGRWKPVVLLAVIPPVVAVLTFGALWILRGAGPYVLTEWNEPRSVSRITLVLALAVLTTTASVLIGGYAGRLGGRRFGELSPGCGIQGGCAVGRAATRRRNHGRAMVWLVRRL